MARLVLVTGVKEIIQKTAAIQLGKSKQMEIGLKAAGLFLQAESQRIVPIDTSNLKNSAFTRAKYSGFLTDVTVGYTALYAIFVHEDLSMQHAPGKTAKFLENPAKEKRKRILQIIYGRMGKKLP